MPLIESSREEEVLERLRAVGVPILPPPHYGYRVIKKLLDYTDYLETMENRTLSIVTKSEASGREPVKTALSEHESKLLFQKFGIPCPSEEIAETEEEAVQAAAAIGYPVVLKIESGDILHKSEAGGVKVGIACDEEVRTAYRKILENAKKYNPQALILSLIHI